MIPLKNNNQYKYLRNVLCSPLPELLEHDAVGESLSADSDALQHSVTPELLQDQVGVHLPGLQHSSRPTITARVYRLFSVDCSLAQLKWFILLKFNVKKTQMTYPLLVVGDDAADKVGLGVVQRNHQFAQRLLVKLTHCAEHALLGFGRRTLWHLGDGLQTHNPIRWHKEKHRKNFNYIWSPWLKSCDETSSLKR